MTVFFNLKTLEAQANGDAKKMLAMLEFHHKGTIPKRATSKYKPSRVSLKGNSWLLNPDPLYKSNTDINYIVQYIKLAARRDYTLYKLYNDSSLDTSFFPDLMLEKISHNPLLKIDGKHIKFKYERQTNGT